MSNENEKGSVTLRDEEGRPVVEIPRNDWDTLRAHTTAPAKVVEALLAISVEIPEELRPQVHTGLQFLAGDPGGLPFRLTLLAMNPDGSDRWVMIHHPDGRKLQVREDVWGYIERCVKAYLDHTLL